VVGADQDAAEDYTSARLSGPLAVVVGGEGKGLSRLSKEKCDFLVRLPMRGHINSLNAGVAAAILLYEVTRQRDATH
jgi:23S rRNA (guanosine2251-2'-O)-methyltransferase